MAPVTNGYQYIFGHHLCGTKKVTEAQKSYIWVT